MAISRERAGEHIVVAHHPNASAGTLDELADACAAAGLAPEEVPYPARLLRLGKEAPPFVFISGNASLMRHPLVGFTGSREATPAALAVTRRVAAFLAREGWGVISGHARGVDQAAHAAALEAGGATIYVPVVGIAEFAPGGELRRLHDEGNWCVFGVAWPQQGWSVHAAMRRNRIIAALADLVVAVAPRESGGTLHCAMTAARLETPLWLLPREEDAAADLRRRLCEAAHVLDSDLWQREDAEARLHALVEVSAFPGDLDALGEQAHAAAPADPQAGLAL